MTFDDSLLEQLDQHWQRYDAAEPADLVDALRDCLAKLSPYTRQLLQQRYAQGLTGPRLADAMNRSLNTVQVALARAQLASSEAQAEQWLLRAPITGVVLDTLLQPGELASTPVMSLGATDAMGVEAYVYDTDIRRVRVGAAATITSYAFAGELTGTVSDVAPLLRSSPAVPIRPDAASDRRVVKVRIALEPADAKRVANLSHQEVEVKIAP